MIFEGVTKVFIREMFNEDILRIINSLRRFLSVTVDVNTSHSMKL
uniref:Uncharacterized protein n=1 Tax=Lepeophtheirus salmonis TaxID=72036 RepID=A0A0K2UBL4_LEPSM